MTSLNIDTQITAVTVYTDRALVTRQGIINLTGTERELILTSLPATIDAESVRVSGKGRVSVKLQGVRIATIPPNLTTTASPNSPTKLSN